MGFIFLFIRTLHVIDKESFSWAYRFEYVSSLLKSYALFLGVRKNISFQYLRRLIPIMNDSLSKGNQDELEIKEVNF